MEITYNLPHVFNPSANSEDNAYALRALLDCLTSINLGYLRNHSVPHLYRAGVVYGRTKLWEPIPAILARGYGDCKSLTPWLLAQYKREGVEARPVFRWIKNPMTGATDFHILVERLLPNGTLVFEDPSRVLGMGANENARPR